MKADTKVVEHISINMKDSGAAVLEETFKYSKTIGKAVASKLGLSGPEADAKAAQIQRTLRRVRLALENR
jgi:hypothetical protein